MRCEHCGSSQITSVSFTTAGNAVYHRCRFCESSWWESDGKPLRTEEILSAAASIEPARRRS